MNSTLELIEEKKIKSPKGLKNLGIRRTERKRIVIVGGGFAGLNLIKGLSKAEYQIVLLDKQNHHTFQPLLYQIATCGLEVGATAYPLRKPLKDHPDCHFRMTEVRRVEPDKNMLHTSSGTLFFDYLVIASGAKPNFFGMDSVAENAYPMKSLKEAMSIRNKMLKNFEKALLTRDTDEKEMLTNIVISGGGPTGVELAGAIAEFKKYIMPKDYPDIDPSQAKIYLIEMLPELLPPMSDQSSAKSEKYLKDLGVEVLTETKIEAYDGETVKTNKGDFPTRLMIWTGGVSGAFIEGIKEDLINKKGRVKVDKFARISGHENIFVLGDVAQIETEDFPEGHPQLAAVAVQQGKYLAKQFKRLEKGKSIESFKYTDRGTMATIGRKKAVVDLSNGWKFQGAFAWFLWLGVHLLSLIGFKNKVVTLANWFWNYTSRDRETRLIVE